MRVLAIDTATEACSAALLSGEELISRFAEGGKSHAPQILGMVEAVLAQAGATLSMLDGIAASVGPGAFTGVRISVAVAQGLAFGAGLPVIGITTLEALAYQRVREGTARVLACLDARMGEVYWGCFAADAGRGLRAVTPARVGAPGSLVLPEGTMEFEGHAESGARPGGGVPHGAYRGIGRGFAAYPELGVLPGLEFDPADGRALPRADEFARLGLLRLGLGEGRDPADLAPVYLRDKVALTEAERGLR